ncbi:glycosyltransferase family 2 protein, partial [Acinetobacter baumannii]
MQRKIIVLTPIKNEAWILKTFLEVTSFFADHIIIADQGSTDESRDIALSFEKVILIPNNDTRFNEVTRQQLLINYCRSNF